MFVTWISFLYHSLFLVTPLLFFWGNSELFEVNKMLFIYIVAILVGGLWIARSVVEKKIYWKKHPLVTLLLVFLIGQIIATIFSIHWRTSLIGYYSRLNGGLISSIAFVTLALGLFNNIPKKKLLSFFLSHALGLLLVSLYALPEHFGVSPSCYLLHQTVGTACWKQDVQARIFGTFGQPNWLASYIVGVFPLIFFLREQYKKHLPMLGEFIIILSALTVWFTRSRSGIFGILLVIALMAILFVYKKYHWLKKVCQNKLFLPFSIIFTILITIIGSSLLQQRTLNDLDSLDLSQGTDSFSIRTIVWEGAIKTWLRYPLTGSGPATFAYSFYQDRPIAHNLVSEWDFLYNKAHNEFINYLSETGIIGFSTYMAFLLGAIYLLWQRGKKYKSWNNSSWMVLVSLLGLSAVHFFGFSIATTNLLIFTLPVLALSDETFDKKKIKLNSWWQYLVLAILALLVIGRISSIVNFWRADRLYKKSKEQQLESKYLNASQSLQEAIELSPKEALFYDELADVYSILSFQYEVVGKKETSKKIANASIENSNYALILNPRHLNFYKTRARIFLILAQSDTKFYTDAEHTLLSAIDLSPNDAKLYYNLGLIQKEMGELEKAQQSLEKAVYLKPNYLKARDELGILYAETKQSDKSLEQFSFILKHMAIDDPFFLAKYKNVEATASGINNEN
jgi:putative inorganic carbon (hco3(-)) transporter